LDNFPLFLHFGGLLCDFFSSLLGQNVCFPFFLSFLFSLLFGVECGYIRLGVNTSSFLVPYFIISFVTIYLMFMAMTEWIIFDDNIKLLFAGSM
jgi:hypothetical protein